MRAIFALHVPGRRMPMTADWRLNGKEKIWDIFRRLYFHPLVYCLYEKTRKGDVKWERDSWERAAEDGGIRFTLSYHYGLLLGVTDIVENDTLKTYSARGVASLFELVCKIENAPDNTRRQARLDKYLEENCR
jgi:hypothetical protein